MSSKRNIPSEDIDNYTGPSKKRTKIDDDEQSSSEDNEMDASQRPGFKTSPQEEAEVGIIEKISLRNFMCHDKLDMVLGPNVNFLIGRNGSGKSAILTGIVVGLGGKATTTNRGTSIKGFIKNGKTAGSVTVKLRNRGPDAYKSREYGPTITVERRISSEGASGYKLRNSEGKIVSTKREELTHILDQFNIQVDNPVAVLNQETSRNFLHSKSPHDKYKFFLKATQLEQMKYDYVTANEYKDNSIRVLKDKEETMPEIKKNVAELESKFKAFDAIEDLRNKIGNLKNEMAWAIVTEREKALQPIRQELKTEDMRMPKFVKHVEESQQKISKFIQAYDGVQNQVKQMSKEIKSLEPQHQEMKAVRDDKKKTLKQIQNEMVMLKKEMRSNESDKKQIEDRIKELRQSVQHNYEDQRRAREERIQQQQEQLDTLRAQQKTTEHSMEQFRLAIAKAKELQYKIQNDEQDIKRSKDQIQNQIHNLESARSNRLKRFGSYMPELIEKINDSFRRKQFHQKPRGPIGVSLVLHDQKWARAVEVCLGGLLHAFCVTDHNDERQLQKLMKQVIPKNGKQPAIITSQFKEQVHNVEQYRVRSAYPTVLDMIDLKELDPVLTNCLIDQRGIESILLIAESNEARQVMSNQPPKNTKEAYTTDGDQLYCHPTFRYYSNTKKQTNLLTANLEEDISALKEHFHKYEADLNQIHKQIAMKKDEIRSNSHQEKITQTQINKIREQIVRFDFEIQELKSYEEPSAPDVTTLEEEVVRYNEMIEDVQRKLDNIDIRLQDSKGEYELAEKAYGEVDKKIRSIAQNSDPVQEDLAKLEAQIEKAKSDKRHYENKMKEYQKNLKELRQNLETRESAVQENINKASQICERIVTRRAAKNIESEIIQIQKRITAEEKSRGNKEEITKEYYEALKEFQRITKEVSQLKYFLKKLTDTLHIRDHHHWMYRKRHATMAGQYFIMMLERLKYCGKITWEHQNEECHLLTLDGVMSQRQQQYSFLRRMIALRAKYFFIMMLNNRQYTGKIVFDHNTEILNLSVQPSKTSGEEVTKTDVRSLSGGERSFSTVCFILALWDAMESPFRMLDEFDVFMDMVNRRVSMEMMMTTASGQPKRQFIFLTPLDMSYLKKQSNTKIFQLRAPERGQTTLSFGETGDDDEEEAGPSGQ